MIWKQDNADSRFNYIDALFIKKLRKDYGHSVDFLSEQLNINRSHLYDVESGKKSVTPNVLNAVLNYYGVNYSTDLSIYESCYSIVLNLVESWMFNNSNEFDSEYTRFKSKENYYRNSKAFIMVDLIECMHNIIHEKYQLNNDYVIDECKKYVPVYDNTLSVLCAVCDVTDRLIEYDYLYMKNVLLKTYENYSLATVNPLVAGLLYFNLGRVYSHNQTDYLKAFNAYQKSIELFQACNCISRVLLSKILIATISFRLGNFDSALNEYLSLKKSCSMYGDVKREIICCNQIAYIYIVNKQYKKCLEYVEKSIRLGSKFPDLDIYKVICSYYLDSKTDCKALVNKTLKHVSDSYVFNFVNLIKSLLNNNENNIKLFSQKLISYIEDANDQIEAELLFNILLDYYKNTDNKESLYILYSKYTDIFKLVK